MSRFCGALSVRPRTPPRSCSSVARRQTSRISSAWQFALEDTGVALYNGQAGNLTPASLAAAAEIVSVEARHAAWARDLAGEIPAPVATDTPADEDQVKARLTQLGVKIA